GIYIVSDSTDVIITIKDTGGANLGVSWNPVDSLYAGPGSTSSLPPNIPYPGNIYFHSTAPFETYSYTGTYQIPGCSGTTDTDITIVTEGFVYSDFCLGDSKTLADITLLTIPKNNLSWYQDKTGNTS